MIPISAKEETGITDLEEKIREMFFSGEINFNDEVYITNERHRQELLKTVESLSLVENSIESGMPEDFYSIDLTDAYESLGRILGESLGEDLVNEIFSKFCMGKYILEIKYCRMELIIMMLYLLVQVMRDVKRP